jgi:hypothetical protein
VIGLPLGSDEPLSMLALAVPPALFATTVTFLATATGKGLTVQLNTHVGIFTV